MAGAWRAALLAAGLMMLGPPCAAQPSSGLLVDGMAPQFNAAAVKLEMPLSIALEECKVEQYRACTYDAGTGVRIFVGAMPDMKRVKKILVHMASAGVPEDERRLSAIKFLSVITVLMSILSPSAKKDEVGAAARNFVEVLGRKNQDYGETVFHGVKYKYLTMPGLVVAAIERR
ncbi:hypothetical protein GJ689_23310 [Rhodoplanes serenus]|uniref:Uncharacterized protein n=1 Tax=Rhodoplanes serenus TaxID=200615 RepID=A0A9X4XQW4_9BRAD|nr:hypothetical protein [Rhodoplanes serenus]MTW19132.1 hypothetical protein [Rhodoplanes serenus]